jgi:hypothetical protein
MYTFQTLTDTVVVEPTCLDHNLQKHVAEKAKAELVGSCSETRGYIVDIEDVQIQSAKISRADTTLRFEITFRAKTIFPKKGDVYRGVTLADTIQHEDFCGGLFTIVNVERKNGEPVPVRVFVTNGVKNNNRFAFAQCGCSIPCVTTPTPCSLENIVVDCLIYKDGEFRIIGQHVHLV